MPRLSGLLSLAAVVAFAYAATALRAESAEDFAPLEQRIVAFRLENGLRIILCPRGTSPVVSCVTSVLAGSADEATGQAGFAHLLARMALDAAPANGNETYAALLRRAGAQDLNACAGADATLVTASLPAAQLESWAALEAARLTDFAPRDFENVRRETLEAQHAEQETQPFGWLSRHFLHAAFPLQGYGHPRLGLSPDVEAATPDALRAFFRARHVPSNIVVAIAGGFDPSQARSLLTAQFSKLPAAPPSAGLFAESPRRVGMGDLESRPTTTCERRLIVEFFAEPILLAGYPIPPRAHADTPALELLAELASARLHERLVQGGHARSCSVWLGPGTRRPRLVLISAEPGEERPLERLESALDEELARLGREPVPADELQRAASACRARRLRELSAPLGLAAQLAEHETLDGGWSRLFADYRSLAAVNAEQLQAVAARYLVPNRRVLAQLRRPDRSGETVLGVPVTPPEAAR